MPSTITTYYTFQPATKARSSQVNTNFSNYRGDLLPINEATATASNEVHNLGAIDHRWNTAYLNEVDLKTSTSTASLILKGDTTNANGAFLFQIEGVTKTEIGSTGLTKNSLVPGSFNPVTVTITANQSWTAPAWATHAVVRVLGAGGGGGGGWEPGGGSSATAGSSGSSSSFGSSIVSYGGGGGLMAGSISAPIAVVTSIDSYGSITRPGGAGGNNGASGTAGAFTHGVAGGAGGASGSPNGGGGGGGGASEYSPGANGGAGANSGNASDGSNATGYGAGGGGGGASGAAAGGSGGNAAAMVTRFIEITGSNVYSITVGTGGTGGLGQRTGTGGDGGSGAPGIVMISYWG